MANLVQKVCNVGITYCTPKKVPHTFKNAFCTNTHAPSQPTLCLFNRKSSRRLKKLLWKLQCPGFTVKRWIWFATTEVMPELAIGVLNISNFHVYARLSVEIPLISKMKCNQTLFIVIFIIVRGSQSGKVYLIDVPYGPEKLSLEADPFWIHQRKAGLPLDFINSGNNFSWSYGMYLYLKKTSYSRSSSLN